MSANKDPEWELLPPERPAGAHAELARWLALIMDELIRIPGTKFRFGLDPIIGLIPGLGDTSSSLFSALALIQGARAGLPKIVLARMALNILINQVVGIIPFIGDVFSFWFKSNTRNYRILSEHARHPREPKKSDWVFVLAILLLMAGIILGGILISLWLLALIGNRLAGLYEGR